MTGEEAESLLAEDAQGAEVISVEVRDERWLARLADGRMAWFPSNAEAAAGLARERRILDLIEARCAFRAPRVRYVSSAGWDVRDPVPGNVDATALYHRAMADEGLARALGARLGEILADQHAIAAQDLRGWLPDRIGWPLPRAGLDENLPKVTADATLLSRCGRLLDAYFDSDTPAQDQVLVHGDLGFHNLALSPGTDRIAGVFDYDGAAFADRNLDFRYLLFDRATTTMLDAAIAAYEPLSGARIDRNRVALFNAASAVGFLAFRDGHAPDEPWCGRTLLEDLAWCDLAIARAGF